MDSKFPRKLYQHPVTNNSPLVNPLSIILVKNGSKGDRLLFRYPFRQTQLNVDQPEKLSNSRYPFESRDNAMASTKIQLQITPVLGSGSQQRMTKYPSVSSTSSIGRHPIASTTTTDSINTKLMQTPAFSNKELQTTSGDVSSVSASMKNVTISDKVDVTDGDMGAQLVPEKEKAPSTSPASIMTSMSTNITPNTSANTSTSSLQSLTTLTTPINKSTPIITTTTNTLLHSSALLNTGTGRIHSASKYSTPGVRDRCLAANTSSSDILSQLSDKDLSNLLSVSHDLTEKKFELKINQVRFVGFPTLMQHPNMKHYFPVTKEASTIKIFHIVFCVRAMASHSIVKCFYDLSKRLGIGLRHEEYRCSYLSNEIRKIVTLLDDASHSHELSSMIGTDHDMEENYFEQVASDILAQSSLAQLMKQVYDDICQTGFVKLKINHWVQISFCLPQKVHVLPYRDPQPIVEPEHIHRCLEAIRPYHAVLLLVDREELVASFGVDATSTIPRFLQVYSPLKSLQVIAADSDLTLSHVVEIASHLVYWSMATIIYPICETNIYVVAPDVPITSTELDDAFLDRFPGLSLPQTLSDFSVPSQLGDLINPILGGSYVQSQVIQLVCWLLQNHLLIQLHSYIYLITYLDQAMDASFACENDNGFDGNLSLCPPYYEPDEDDDITVSDSYSETTGDDFITSPIPPATSSALSTSEASTATTVVGSNGEDFVDGMSGVSSSDNYTTAGADSDERDSNSNHSSTRNRTSTPGPPRPTSVPIEKIKGTIDELSDPVRRAVMLVKQPISMHDVKLFGRLSKYFNGEFHVEEIMYMENMRRSQVLLLLDKFRDVLITVEKEDDDINIFRRQ